MKKRVVYFDYLRVVAIISVMILHVSAQNWETANVKTLAWNALNFYNGIVRWGVPIFVMISGALFLSREVDIGRLYKKNISRMLVAYLFWSTFYAVSVPLIEYIFTKNIEISVRTIVSDSISGQIHMWFIPMIVGLYMCIPVIKGIVQSRSIAKYFIVLSFVFAVAIPQFVSMVNDFVGGVPTAMVNVFYYDVIEGDMKLYFVLGFPFYFILGHFMQSVELSRKQRIIVYTLGGVGFAATVGLTAFATWNANKPMVTYYGEFCLNVLAEVMAVFVWFKHRKYNNTKLNAIVSELAKCSFGAYLIHILVISILQQMGFDTLMCSPIISVPVISLLTIVISFSVSWLLNRIPIINKWIV